MGKTEMAELERLLEAATATTIRGQHWDAYSHAARQAVPSLIAAVRERDAVIAAVRELADDWLEGRTVLDGSKQMELIATTLAVLPGVEQEDTK